MSQPDAFDAFYKEARDRLLLQTYALTGDLPASRSAVRDSFVHAWHHWRKVSRREDPEAWVRPHAWAHAQRRHTARIWHRDKKLDAEAKATLEALAKLPLNQRRALLLTHLSSVSMETIARELGLPQAEAERLLQTATARFAVTRDLPTTSVRGQLEQLRSGVENVTWPRSTILRRAGDARRRTHTLIGVVATLAAVVVSGSVATDLDGVRPSLAGGQVLTTGEKPDGDRQPSPPPLSDEFSEDAMLSAEQVAAHVPGEGWRVASTNDNSGGNGLALPCQRARYADPKGSAALVRTFDTGRRKGPAPQAFQATEVSASSKAANRAFGTAVRWFGACTEARPQLVSTQTLGGVGDEAVMLVLRSWGRQTRTLVAGVARTGRLTSAMVLSTPGAGEPEVDRTRDLMVEAVNTLCAQAGAGSCATDDAKLEPTTPVPVAMAPGMLGEIDIPPVRPVRRPWVGTEPRKAIDNTADTPCDSTSFNSDRMTNNLTRSFLIPGADLPASFGITETVGTLPQAPARGFVAEIRRRLASCPDRELGTDVARLAEKRSRDADLSAWRVTTELSEDTSITYLMGIVRSGGQLAQVGFIAGPRVTMAPDEFVALVERAQERLAAMPEPD